MVSKKIVLVGDFSTGKTSLIRRFVDNQFSDSYLSTIGVKISKKIISLEYETVQALIWDIEGGTPQKAVNTTYLVGAHGCILVADSIREETIDSIDSYIETVGRCAPKAAMILVLNKCDMLNEMEKEKLRKQMADRFHSRIKHIFFTSAKTGEEVEAMFHTIAMLVSPKG